MFVRSPSPFRYSWSRTGHKLLTSSTDNTACLWDVVSGECEHRYRFPSPVLRVQFNPRNVNEFLVCPMRHPAILLSVNKKQASSGDDDDGGKATDNGGDGEGAHDLMWWQNLWTCLSPQQESFNFGEKKSNAMLSLLRVKTDFFAIGV